MIYTAYYSSRHEYVIRSAFPTEMTAPIIITVYRQFSAVCHNRMIFFLYRNLVIILVFMISK